MGIVYVILVVCVYVHVPIRVVYLLYTFVRVLLTGAFVRLCVVVCMAFI